jgi:predicted transcriptional regulator
MSTNDNVTEATDVLQKLGLKEYEAECFVGLTRLSTGTAKQLSEITDVPRTRVYDAIRVLEAQGLVEIQHSSPKEFRAVPIGEAVETLHDQYDDRIEDLRSALESLDPVDESDQEPVQEVWSLSGSAAIENRANDLVDDANTEIVLIVGDESLLTDELEGRLNNAGPDVDIIIGAATESLQETMHEAVPGATTFVSGLEWLRSVEEVENGGVADRVNDGGVVSDADAAIGRLLLVDRSAFLVSSLIPDTGKEQAVFGSGFGNGLVVIARRLMAQGLVTGRDPGEVDAE